MTLDDAPITVLLSHFRSGTRGPSEDKVAVQGYWNNRLKALENPPLQQVSPAREQMDDTENCGALRLPTTITTVQHFMSTHSPFCPSQGRRQGAVHRGVGRHQHARCKKVTVTWDDESTTILYAAVEDEASDDKAAREITEKENVTRRQ